MGYIYLYTGTGGGKTANALGLALRSAGHDKKTVIIQFCKWQKDTGEYLIKEKLGDLYEIHQFGREAWLGIEATTEEFGGEKFKIEKITDRDKELAEYGLAFALRAIQEKKPHLLVLDEINLVVYWKLLAIESVLKVLDNIPEETTVVMTGRYAPKELIQRADFVNIITETKMPKSFKAEKGIQY